MAEVGRGDEDVGRGLTRRSFLKRGAVAGIGGVVGSQLEGFGHWAAATSPEVRDENARAGAPPSEWEPSRSASIVGFTSSMSYLPGQTVEFKVSTPATAWRARIYRMGWYGGAGARRVAEVLPSVALPQVQPAPLAIPEVGLVDCGSWATSATWTVPAGAVSGVYLARLERLDVPGESSAVLFVVRRSGPSDILVQTSDMTWQAYNMYGGANLYAGSTPRYRGHKVSYNRPVDLGGALENDFLSAEYPLVRWLERNGYDVAYCSGLDVHADGALLLRTKVFVSSGHDEYVSGPQRAHVEAARDAGVHLMFLTGNEYFWKTRLEPSIAPGAAPDRTLVCYKESHDGAKIDPSPEWTGTWRDPRFSPPSDGGRPENELTGQLFRCIEPSSQLDHQITVPYPFSRLRFWRNTSIAGLQPGDVGRLAPSTLGYEWDVDAVNDVRPAGLVHLSETTRTCDEVLQDFSSTYRPETVTHHAALHRAASGALVFGSGTVQWSFGLDDYHVTDEGTPTSQPMQQATLNLLADMGVQPTTRQPGLVAASASTDTIAPTSTITTPAPTTTVPVGTPLTVSGSAVDSGGGRVAAVEVSIDGGTTWTPATGTSSWTCTVVPVSPIGPRTVRARAVDDSCNLEAPGPSVAIEVGPRPLPASIWSDAVLPVVTAVTDPNPVEVGVRFRPAVDGFIVGLRFYKGAENGGLHTGHLWTNSGALLATATFAGETASGWQTVAIPPVPVSEGVTYLASCHMPAGRFSVDTRYFESRAVDLWPLRALAHGEDGPNGVFRYGPPGFPTDSVGGSNYWVDVLFDITDHRAPTVVDHAPAAGLESVHVGTTVSVQLSEAMDADSIVFELLDAEGVLQAGSGVYDRADRRFTFTPAAPLAPLSRHTARLKSARDRSGEPLASPFEWSFVTTGPPGTLPTSIWDTSATPVTATVVDAPVELGVKLRSDRGGSITALRFFKAPTSAGPHVGHLWTLAGELLATVSFDRETVSGWQQADLDPPVAIAPGVTYIASYHAADGRWARSASYFQAGSADRGPLHAPDDASAAGNGVYRYGTTPGFPVSSNNGNNYWVDVVLKDQSGPAVVDLEPAPGLVSVAPDRPLRATFDEPVAPGSLTFELRDGGAPVPAAVIYDSASRTATLTPQAPLGTGRRYTASVHAADEMGNAMPDPRTWTFTTTVAGGSTPATIWDTSAIPAVAAASDASAVELGTRFRVDRRGTVTAIRFYKGPGNGGPHVGRLWTATGQLLGSAAFADETATGWQQASLSAPAEVVPGQDYVVSYHAPGGRYSVTSAAFTGKAVERPPLRAPSSSSAAGNGLYRYGAGGFPSASHNGTCYWVDVVFEDAAGPAVSAVHPAAGATDVPVDVVVAVVFDEPVEPSSVGLELRDDGGALVAGSVSFDAATSTARLAPAAPLVGGRTYTAAVTGALDLGGNPMAAPLVWSFTTLGASVLTLWPATATPAVAAAADGSAVELGTRFTVDVAGTVRGMRFFKGPGNAGPHVGHLWDASGTLLATVQFSGETETGWQSAAFAAPVPVQAGAVYVVSYLAPVGRYAVTGGGFATEVVNGPLRGLRDGAAGGNGLYRYGAGGGFPTSSWNASCYWVDLLFQPGP